MKLVIDQHGYPCAPRKLDPLSCFYEEKHGLSVVTELFDGARTATIKIPWRKLEAAVDWHRKVKSTKKRLR